MDLFEASHQWAKRQPDERFESLGDLSIKLSFKDNEVTLDGTKGVSARMSIGAFDQSLRRLHPR